MSCPRHPRWDGRGEECPFCEAEIARQEIARDDPSEDGVRVDEARYERWLDEIGER